MSPFLEGSTAFWGNVYIQPTRTSWLYSLSDALLSERFLTLSQVSPEIWALQSLPKGLSHFEEVNK